MEKTAASQKTLRKVSGNFGRFIGLVSKYLKITARDKPNWFWFLGYPLLFMMIFTAAFRTPSVTQYDIAFINYDGDLWGSQTEPQIMKNMSTEMINLFDPENKNSNLSKNFKVMVVESEEDGKAQVDTSGLEALIIIPANFTELVFGLVPGAEPVVIVYAKPDPQIQALVANVINSIINQMVAAVQGVQLGKVDVQSAREQIRIFDYLMPGIVIAGITVAIMNVAQNVGKDKESKVMQRLDTTPVPRSIQMLASGAGQLVFSALQTTILFACLFIFGVEVHEDANIALAFLVAMAMSFTCIGLGIIVAAVVKDANEAGGIAWVVILPLQFLGGALALMEVSGLPTTIAVQAIRGVLVYGLGWTYIWKQLLYQMIYGCVFLAIGLGIFKAKTNV